MTPTGSTSRYFGERRTVRSPVNWNRMSTGDLTVRRSPKGEIPGDPSVTESSSAPTAVLTESESGPPDPTLGIEARPDVHKVGMACFLASEAAFFSTLIMAYVIYLRHGSHGPTPDQVFSLPMVLGNTACLIFSSFTLHWAEKAHHSGKTNVFRVLWAATIVLGTLFLVGTGIEWRGLIRDHGLTIGVNMFGSTYYTLVGFHAFHVTLGVIALAAVLWLSVRGELRGKSPMPVTLVGWYWHFVDVVWVIVFLVVYVVGR
ncbi:MAG: heme-copper oxidase subunit III [Planctomycetaceae bacterium]|nr:heme-copper oxidase subunit III [Planctomycetaceae bacterium]